MKTKFKKRYVLGMGYPKFHIEGTLIDLRNRLNHVVDLEIPLELWLGKTPKYRLVLERVKEGK